MLLRVPTNFREVSESTFNWWIDRVAKSKTVTREPYSNGIGFYVDGKDAFNPKLIAAQIDGRFCIPR